MDTKWPTGLFYKGSNPFPEKILSIPLLYRMPFPLLINLNKGIKPY